MFFLNNCTKLPLKSYIVFAKCIFSKHEVGDFSKAISDVQNAKPVCLQVYKMNEIFVLAIFAK